MEDLFDYLMGINEERMKPEDQEMKKISGQDADKTSKRGVWGLEEPLDDTPKQELEIDPKELSRNMRILRMKFDTEEPFFIEGEAGWGKTSIVTDMAHKYGRYVLTVYLDKAMKEDLGGIPIPREDKRTGRAYQDVAMPGWGNLILEHPKHKFLLFFDEMNQADPGVMNALMPIVLKKEVCGEALDNAMIGAAGNFEYENEGGVNKLSGPLKSRFKPIITWESGTDEAWQAAFKYLHNKWDEKLGTKFVNEFEKKHELFQNPRELDHKIFNFIYKLINKGHAAEYEPEDYLERMEGSIKEDLSRSKQSEVASLADYVYQFAKAGGNSENIAGRRGRRKDEEMLDDEQKSLIRQGLVNGWVSLEGVEGVRFGISEENILDSIEWDVPGQIVQRYINKLLAEGKKFRYKTDKEFLKDGFTDPNTWDGEHSDKDPNMKK